MENEFGMRELYSVLLKTTSSIEIEGKYLAAGETVAAFDKVQLANFKELSRYITAHGGYEDRDRVIWQTTKEVDLVFTQGIFSKTQLAIMSNAKLYKLKDNESFAISHRETLETTEEGLLTLSHNPIVAHGVFIYIKETGEKVLNCSMASENTIQTSLPYTDVVVDYDYLYTSGATSLIVGQRTLDGYLSLEGKTRVKDDITGTTRTGIIKVPKLKLTSDLSITLGTNANPQVGRFEGKALPIGPYGKTKAMEILFLDEDIDSDM